MSLPGGINLLSAAITLAVCVDAPRIANRLQLGLRLWLKFEWKESGLDFSTL